MYFVQINGLNAEVLVPPPLELVYIDRKSRAHGVEICVLWKLFAVNVHMSPRDSIQNIAVRSRYVPMAKAFLGSNG